MNTPINTPMQVEEQQKPKRKSTITARPPSPNTSTTVNDKTGDRKKKTVDWLGERLVEKLDRDHYMCIMCFKRMSRGYASCHCNEEHATVTDEMKPFIVKGYLNGKRVFEEMDVPKTEEKKETQQMGQMSQMKTETQEESKDGKTPKKKSKMTQEMKQRLDRLENEGKYVWETKPKKELEKERTAEGKRVTMEISKIMASSGIPFAKSDAILKIVHEVIGSANKLGPQVLEKIRFSARTLKRRHDETVGGVPLNRPSQAPAIQPNATEGQLPQPTNTQVPNVPNVFTPANTNSIVLNGLI